MTNNIANISRKFNRDICKRFDVILKNIMAQSETTEELVKQTQYVENLRSGELMDLRVSQQKHCIIAHTRILYYEMILLKVNT